MSDDIPPISKKKKRRELTGLQKYMTAFNGFKPVWASKDTIVEEEESQSSARSAKS